MRKRRFGLVKGASDHLLKTPMTSCLLLRHPGSLAMFHHSGRMLLDMNSVKPLASCFCPLFILTTYPGASHFCSGSWARVKNKVVLNIACCARTALISGTRRMHP